MPLPPALAPVVDLVFPPRCPLCGAGLRAQLGLCTDCWSGLAIPGEPSCASCQRPFPENTPADAICAPCLASPPRHDGIAAGTLYNDTARQLVLAFKHGRRIALAPMLARLISARLGPLEPGWVIVPVPLHRWRLWRRGFNQAALLAREVARSHNSLLAVDVLVRSRQTPVLGGLGRKARKRALSGAIQVDAQRAHLVRGRDIVLVDDVMTSGATTDACVSALKRAGASKVRIACFARVLDEALEHAAQKENARSTAPGA